MCGPSPHFAPISIAGSSVSGELSYGFTADPNPRNGGDVDDLRRAGPIHCVDDPYPIVRVSDRGGLRVIPSDDAWRPQWPT